MKIGLKKFTGLFVLIFAIILLLFWILIDNVKAYAGVDSKFSKDESNTGIGIWEISNPDEPENKDSLWSGSYVYFGRYDSNNDGIAEPVLYRVLDRSTKKYNFTEDETESSKMFLDCDNILYYQKFDSDNKPNHEGSNQNSWDESDIAGITEIDYEENGIPYGLNYINGGFIYKSFSDAEYDAIAESAVIDHDLITSGTEYPDVTESVKNYYGKYVSLGGEKIFLLDVEDVSNPKYGYHKEDGENHIKKTNKELGDIDSNWWLRSANLYDSALVGEVYNNGKRTFAFVNNNEIGVCPALNIDTSSILLSSLIPNGEDETRKRYKLTIKDKSLSINIKANTRPYILDTGISSNIKMVCVPYEVKGNPDKLSVVVTDGEWNNYETKIKRYTTLDTFKEIGEEGIAVFALPLNYNASNDKIYLLCEKRNSVKETDYASEPLEIEHIHIFNIYGGYTSGSGSDVITIKCNNEGCNLPENQATLKMVLPLHKIYDDGKDPNVRIEKSTEIEDFDSYGLQLNKYYYNVNEDGGIDDVEMESAPKDAGKYLAELKITSPLSNKYAIYAHVVYTINKASPQISVLPKATDIVYGSILGDSVLTGGTANVAGTFTWKDSTIVPKISDSDSTEYTVLFTPNDTKNYNTTEISIKIKVNKLDFNLSYLERIPEIPCNVTTDSYKAILDDLASQETSLGRYTMKNPAQIIVEGDNDVELIYTPKDTNYNNVEIRHNFSVAHVSAGEEKINEVAATCTAKGSYDLISKCKYCGIELSCQHVETDKKDHVEGAQQKVNNIDATCTSKGSYDLVTKCEVCGTELSHQHVETDMINHVEGVPQKANNIDATCTSKGSYDLVNKCEVCGTELSHQHVETDMIDHVEGVPQKANNTDATCTSKGSYDLVTKCEVCGIELSHQHIETEKLEHNKGDWQIVTAASASQNGKKVKKCTDCGTVLEEETIPATNSGSSSGGSISGGSSSGSGSSGSGSGSSSGSSVSGGSSSGSGSSGSGSGSSSGSSVSGGSSSGSGSSGSGSGSSSGGSVSDGSSSGSGSSGSGSGSGSGSSGGSSSGGSSSGSGSGSGSSSSTGTGTGTGTVSGTSTGAGTTTGTGTTSGTGIKPEVKNKLKVGDIITDAASKAKYKVTANTSKKHNVAYISYEGKSETVNVPATITVDNVTFKVVIVAAKSFTKNKNITKITIQNGVKYIRKNTFAGCEKLKKLVIRTKLLNTKTLAKGAFNKLPATCKIYVSKDLKDTYTELFKAKGLSKKIKITNFKK